MISIQICLFTGTKIFHVDILNMAQSVDVHMRILDQEKKSKFSHFILKSVPKLAKPNDLKQYLVANHPEVLAPAVTSDFPFGYFLEGRGNKRFQIITEDTLAQAYDTIKEDGRLCLWADPHAAKPREEGTLKRQCK